jgi:hypothetical protein
LSFSAANRVTAPVRIDKPQDSQQACSRERADMVELLRIG